jgi:hypothetical protein
VTDECAKPKTPSKVAKRSTGKNEANGANGTSAPVSNGASSPLTSAIAEGEAAATASKIATTSQVEHTAGSLYSEGTTRRLRDTLQQNRQRLEGRLAALEKRSEHLGALTAATGVENP